MTFFEESLNFHGIGLEISSLDFFVNCISFLAQLNFIF